jgi:hypothetical protein
MILPQVVYLDENSPPQYCSISKEYFKAVVGWYVPYCKGDLFGPFPDQKTAENERDKFYDALRG